MATITSKSQNASAEIKMAYAKQHLKIDTQKYKMPQNQTFWKALEIEGEQPKLKGILTNQKSNLKLINPAQENIICASKKNLQSLDNNENNLLN